jgi:hypothetical protein
LDGVSSNIQTQLNSKAPINNPTFTGVVNGPNYKTSDHVTYNSTALTAPLIENGISRGTGDGATYSNFNVSLNSWWSTGFVDTCFKTCNAVINHRNGDIMTNGTVASRQIKTNNIDYYNESTTITYTSNVSPGQASIPAVVATISPISV